MKEERLNKRTKEWVKSAKLRELENRNRNQKSKTKFS